MRFIDANIFLSYPTREDESELSASGLRAGKPIADELYVGGGLDGRNRVGR